MDVKQRIKDLMDQRGWTMYRLSKESDLSWSTVRNVIKLNTDPTISTLEIYCKALGISLSQFFDVEGESGLTEDQRNMMEKWSALNEREKAVVMEMIDLLLDRK